MPSMLPGFWVSLQTPRKQPCLFPLAVVLVWQSGLSSCAQSLCGYDLLCREIDWTTMICETTNLSYLVHHLLRMRRLNSQLQFLLFFLGGWYSQRDWHPPNQFWGRNEWRAWSVVLTAPSLNKFLSSKNLWLQDLLSYRRRKRSRKLDCKWANKSPNLGLLLQDGAVFILRGYVHGPDFGTWWKVVERWVSGGTRRWVITLGDKRP